MTDDEGPWAQELENWRDLALWDDPPTEEAVVSQFVYSAISRFIEQRGDDLDDAWHTDEDGGRIEHLINDWVDAKA